MGTYSVHMNNRKVNKYGGGHLILINEYLRKQGSRGYLELYPYLFSEMDTLYRTNDKPKGLQNTIWSQEWPLLKQGSRCYLAWYPCLFSEMGVLCRTNDKLKYNMMSSIATYEQGSNLGISLNIQSVNIMTEYSLQ